eukprot:COSAG01_NODE_1500_length_10110_cov_4.433923_6_plen_155_part_00
MTRPTAAAAVDHAAAQSGESAAWWRAMQISPTPTHTATIVVTSCSQVPRCVSAVTLSGKQESERVAHGWLPCCNANAAGNMRAAYAGYSVTVHRLLDSACMMYVHMFQQHERSCKWAGIKLLARQTRNITANASTAQHNERCGCNVITFYKSYD